MSRHLVTIAAGDTNLSGPQRKVLAAASGATLVEGHGVDAAFVVGAKVVAVHVLARGGSDHPAIVYVLEAAGQRFTALQWNVYVGQRPARVRRRLRRLIKRWKPDVIMLSEAYRCRAQLARIKGYHLTQGPNVGEGADCALMVRADHHLARTGIKRMRQPWTGPKHRLPKQPRQYPGARIVTDRLAVRALSIHLPTLDRAGRNAPAVDETLDWLTRYIQKGHRS